MHVFYSITVFLFDFFRPARAATGVEPKGSSAALAWPENRSLDPTSDQKPSSCELFPCRTSCTPAGEIRGRIWPAGRPRQREQSSVRFSVLGCRCPGSVKPSSVFPPELRAFREFGRFRRRAELSAGDSFRSLDIVPERRCRGRPRQSRILFDAVEISPAGLLCLVEKGCGPELPGL